MYNLERGFAPKHVMPWNRNKSAVWTVNKLRCVAFHTVEYLSHKLHLYLLDICHRIQIIVLMCLMQTVIWLYLVYCHLCELLLVTSLLGWQISHQEKSIYLNFCNLFTFKRSCLCSCITTSHLKTIYVFVQGAIGCGEQITHRQRLVHVVKKVPSFLGKFEDYNVRAAVTQNLKLQSCNLIWNLLHYYDFTAKYLINFLASSYCGLGCCIIPPIAVLLNSLWTTVAALKQIHVYMLTKFVSSIKSNWRWCVCKTYNIYFVLADFLKRLNCWGTYFSADNIFSMISLFCF
jgi:hypothetical protein